MHSMSYFVIVSQLGTFEQLNQGRSHDSLLKIQNMQIMQLKYWHV